MRPNHLSLNQATLPLLYSEPLSSDHIKKIKNLPIGRLSLDDLLRGISKTEKLNFMRFSAIIHVTKSSKGNGLVIEVNQFIRVSWVVEN